MRVEFRAKFQTGFPDIKLPQPVVITALSDSMANPNLTPPIITSYVPCQELPAVPLPDPVTALTHTSACAPFSDLPSLPNHIQSPPKPLKGKSRAARNTVGNKASRKRRKRGRPKKHWTKQAARQRQFNPKRLRRIEVINLIRADYFASKTGRRLVSFLTIKWALTAHGEADINRRWKALLNGLRIWAARQGFELAHTFSHENPPRTEPAFNTHLLCNVPAALRVAATEWLMKRLGGSAGAIDLQPRCCPGWNRPDDRVSYMCKGTDKATAMKFRLIRKHGWDFAQGVVPFQRSGCSSNLNAKAREAEGFSDTIKTGARDFPAKYAHAREGVAT